MAKGDNIAIPDQPTISREQARLFFNMGKDRFERRWKVYYRHRIDNVETRGGTRLLLTDVVKAAFPKASDAHVWDIAFKYLVYLADKKVEAKMNRLRAKNDSEDGSEGQ